MHAIRIDIVSKTGTLIIQNIQHKHIKTLIIQNKKRLTEENPFF